MAKQENLTSAISRSINRKTNKDDGRKVAFSLDDTESPSEVDHWISTGSTVLDLMLSNQEDGGLPTGKIATFYGDSGSGKTLIANHVLANCQQMGGLSVMIDTEAAADFQFMETIGLDPDGDFLYVQENRLERIFEYIETVIEKVKEADDTDRPVAVVVDSIAGAVPENEYEGDYGKEGYNTDKAIVLSQAMRKITGLVNRENVLLLFTNQVRTDPGVMYGDPTTTPGGKAVKFHSSIRVKMRKSKTIKENSEIVGAKIRPYITKNRLAPPYRDTNFDLYYNSGIDDYGSWWEPLKNADVISHASQGWYYIQDEDGNAFTKDDIPGSSGEDKYKTQEGRFKKKLHDDVEFRQMMYDRLVDAVTHEYEEGWVDRSGAEYVNENGEAAEDADE